MDVIAILNLASSSYCFLTNKGVPTRGTALKFREFISYDRAVTVKITVLRKRKRKESLLRESFNNNIRGGKRKIFRDAAIVASAN